MSRNHLDPSKVFAHGSQDISIPTDQELSDGEVGALGHPDASTRPFPKASRINFILNRIESWFVDLFGNGVPSWNASTQYSKAGVCHHNNEIWKAKIGNANNVPVDGAVWESLGSVKLATDTEIFNGTGENVISSERLHSSTVLTHKLRSCAGYADRLLPIGMSDITGTAISKGVNLTIPTGYFDAVIVSGNAFAYVIPEDSQTTATFMINRVNPSARQGSYIGSAVSGGSRCWAYYYLEELKAYGYSHSGGFPAESDIQKAYGIIYG